MPVTQLDLAALQLLMAAQLSPSLTGPQTLQKSVGAQVQADNCWLTMLTTEQERLACDY